MSGLTEQQLAAVVAQATQAAIAAMSAGNEDAADDNVTAKVLADAPKPATQRKRETTAKAAAASPIKSNTTAVLVSADGSTSDHASGAALPEGVSFVVSATTGTGGLRTNGAAVSAYRDGKAVKAWPREVVMAAFRPECAKSIAKAIEGVDKRAQIGAHRPAAVA